MTYKSTHGVVLIGKEETWGTSVSADKDIGLVQNITPTDDNTLRRVHTIGQRNAHTIQAGRFNASGTIETTFQNGRLLEYAFGSVSHADSVSDSKHTFSESDNLPSFTLENSWNSTSDQARTYAGCMIDTITLAMDLEGDLTMRTDYIAKSVTSSDSASSAVIDSDIAPLADFMAEVKAGTKDSESSLGEVQSFEFTLRNSLNALQALGHREIQDLKGEQREYELRVTLAVDKDQYEKVLGGTEPADTENPDDIDSVILDVDNGVAEDSGKVQFYIQLDDCKAASDSTPTRIGEYVIQELTIWSKALGECYTYDNILENSW